MNEPLGVVVSPRARRQIETAVRWWRANRLAAPDLLEHELAVTVNTLARAPTLGRPMRPANDRLPDLRRVLLVRTRYHVYFAVSVASRTLNLVALWHAERVPPKLWVGPISRPPEAERESRVRHVDDDLKASRRLPVE